MEEWITFQITHRWVDDIKIHPKRTRVWWCVLDSSGLGWGQVWGFCEHINEPFFHQVKQLLDQINNCQLLKKYLYCKV